MDLLNRSDIQSLAASDVGGMHVSLMMPTHRFGGGIQADQVLWKNLVSGAEALLQQDLRRAEVDAILAPARELLNNNLAWQFMSDGLAMYLSAEGARMFRIPASLPTVAAVGDHFVTGPLMRLLSGDAHFLLLGGAAQALATWPIDVGNGGNPGCTKLPRCGRRQATIGCGCRARRGSSRQGQWHTHTARETDPGDTGTRQPASAGQRRRISGHVKPDERCHPPGPVAHAPLQCPAPGEWRPRLL